MTRILAIILSFTILLQSFSFDLDDINKIPALVDHISCHLKSGDSFSEFIAMHYGGEVTNHEQDHKEHKELPFKHHHSDTHFQLIYLICNNNYAIENGILINTSENFTYKEPYTSLLVTTIFQPPKIA
ncbi:hypothetical protein MKD41_04290 [Lutibacter sp. A64]|uniref:hypothetical protein n=1 Tax=Lutibacter sp. A64 TaxID=2918526 RepID=UPI001F053F06|nr:hypothetical protein [Lutibacter sp. A64]UMB54692.1 hypothetical protein MKD41_04290 [Lutibacter sp. A64]